MIESLNLNQLRIFESVHRTGSMTRAARELRMTQSGVSQHIKALEENIGRHLFDRIGKRIVPTEEAKALFSRCRDAITALDEVLVRISGKEKKVAGRVAIGVPVEFGNNVVLPLLAELMTKHPELRIAVRYGVGTEIEAALTSGELDFAFLDSYLPGRLIQLTPVYNETVHLCVLAGARTRDPGTNLEAFRAMSFIDYEPGEQILRMWFDHHLGAGKFVPKARAYGMNARGVSALLLQGFGAGVLPGHLVEELKERGARIRVLEGSGRPLRNKISLALVRDKTASYAASFAEQYLRHKLQNSRQTAR